MSKLLRSVPIAVYLIALFGFAFQMWAGQNYGIFRDEFYYLECARHLAFGYVDHPPFSIFKLWAWVGIFGDSQFSIRIIPSLLFSILIVLTSFITKQLNGSSFAAILSSLAVLASPQILGVTGFYSMNSFELVFWAILYSLLLMIIKGGSKKMWILYGIVLGFGLMNKFSLGILAVALNLCMYFTPLRKELGNKYFLAGNLISFLIFIPFLIWNYLNGYPTLEFMSNASQFKNVDFTVLDFFKAQLLNMGPVTSIFWVLGLLALLFSAKLKEFRVLGFIYVISFIILVTQNSKPYYLSGAYAPLIAAGAIVAAGIGQGRINSAFKFFFLISLIASFIVFSPMAVPVLSPEKYQQYSDFIGIKPEESEHHDKGVLPQHFADRFGWIELAGIVENAFKSLSAEERKTTGIYAQNYGEAGAVKYYGRDKGLPDVICGHNNFWLWGLGERELQTLIIIGGDKEDHEKLFAEVIEFGRTDNKYCMPYENNMPVYIARRPKADLRMLWPQVKEFI